MFTGFRLQRTVALVPPLVCKGLLSLLSAIYLQRTVVHVFCYLFAKDCCPCFSAFCLQLTAVVVSFYFFAKYCCSCFPSFCSQRTAVLLSAFRLENMLKSFL